MEECDDARDSSVRSKSLGDESTFGLARQTIAKLLGIGISAPAPDTQAGRDSFIEQALRARLSGPPHGLAGDSSPPAGCCLLDVLLSEQSDLHAIRAIKDFHKGLAASRRSEAERAAAVAIYYATIASALVFHGHKITRHSIGSLAKSFETLVAEPWMPAELSGHFSRAMALCRNQTDGLLPHS
jgi:hypothetical protein